MSAVEVRLARAAELPDVYRVRDAVFVDEQGVPPELERDEDDPGADHVVVVAGGAVVGTGRLVSRGDGVGVVGRLALLPAARGRGLGAATLALLERLAGERDLVSVELHAQTHARGFYERAGYVAVGPEYDDAGIPHVTMVKAL